MAVITSLDPVNPNTLLNAVTSSGAGPTFAVPRRPGGGAFGQTAAVTWQVVSSPGSASNTVNLEGSLDNTNWFLLDQFTGVGNALQSVAFKPVSFIRANLSSAGVGETVTVLFTF